MESLMLILMGICVVGCLAVLVLTIMFIIAVFRELAED